MITVTNKSKLVFLLTSTALLTPKMARGEIYHENLSSEAKGEVEKISPQDDIHSPSPKNESASIARVESLESMPEFSDYSSKKIADARENNRQLTENKTPQYIIPPRIAENQKINPFTTNFPLNGLIVNHLTGSNFAVSSNFGDRINTTYDYNIFVKINNRIQESLSKDNIYTVEQTGSYVQLQSVAKKREVTVTKIEPRTLVGTEIQLSLIAACIFPGTNPSSQCTYTPGLVTDISSIDPDTLLAKRILQTSNVGDVVTPESLAAIKSPGFQRGANGQDIGVDLFFPNSGSVFSNNLSNQSTITRDEKNENATAGFYSTVRQIVRANDKEAVIGLTVRGFGLIANDKNSLLNSTLQLSGLILPDIDPEITGSENPVNPSINRNLFFAANNLRLPANSFTFYQGGIGRAQTPISRINARQLAPGFFDSVWIGVSPVTKRSLSSNIRYVPTGERQTITTAGAEGGLNSNAALLSVVNDQVFSPTNLQNLYSQIYLAVSNQDTNLVSSSKFVEEINYYPHISITGNITRYDDVWRYYGGLILSDKPNAYIGTDYSKNTSSDWNYFISGIVYSNPDADYYSQVQGSVSKEINLGKNSDLVLSTGLNYAIDRKYDIGGTIFNSPTSSITLGARANLGSISFGLNNYFGDILPNSIGNTLMADMTVKFSDNFLLSGYYTPINENSTRSRYGAQAQFRLGDNKSPSLFLSWANNEYNFGRDTGGNQLSTTNNVFKVLFKSNL